jgi:hypothetical protein
VLGYFTFADIDTEFFCLRLSPYATNQDAHGLLLGELVLQFALLLALRVSFRLAALPGQPGPFRPSFGSLSEFFFLCPDELSVFSSLSVPAAMHAG